MQDIRHPLSANGDWAISVRPAILKIRVATLSTDIIANCWHTVITPTTWDNDKRVELEDNNLNVQYGKGTYSQDLIHGKALEYPDNMNPDEPFFMWYPTIIPHAELIVPEDSIIQKFRGMYPEKPYKGTEPGSPAFRKGRLLFAVPSTCNFRCYGLPSGRLCRADHPKVKRQRFI